MKNIKELVSLLNISLFTLVSVVGYFIAYQFQAGYFSFFSIPNQFIDLSPANIAASIAACSVFFFIFLPSIENHLVPEKGKRRIGVENIIWTSLPILSTFYLMMEGFSKQAIIVTVIVGILIIVLHVLYYKIKIMRSFLRFMDSPREESFFKTFLGISYWNLLIIIVLSYLLIGSFSRIGFFTAKKTSSFKYISLNNKIYAVIAYSDDKLLTMPIDMEKRIIEKKLYIYKFDDLIFDKSPLNLKEISNIRVE